MDKEPGGGRMVGLLAAHVVCCGGIVLMATGAVGGLGTWLLDGGATWLAMPALVAAAGLLLLRRRKGRANTEWTKQGRARARNG